MLTGDLLDSSDLLIAVIVSLAAHPLHDVFSCGELFEDGLVPDVPVVDEVLVARNSVDDLNLVLEILLRERRPHVFLIVDFVPKLILE